ncbi:MAG: DEAD/DEAH box helicase [Bacteroidia bacterium]|nr:DEAD/DEAH box helicase [Bacteroidia bacterium]NND26652.1 DEAD/DEAH box helicase [Flavobacteriaceae bacterium]MBT8279889.1 DEAD/DEAH box helicase [Bacteroidia bacterium]NNK60703.1 DEAD/DEAH box helicase [Flavobacteriaceae bacterium]NNL33901.1 DEAD/DEAH box helicase [Flavobacteriaceae bacterium]
MTFEDFKISKFLSNALVEMGLETPTPIQEAAIGVIASGRDVVGVAQTGTGKTIAYVLPILKTLDFSQQEAPRVLVLVPTRELVIQVKEAFEAVGKYTNHRILGVYGGTNINTQKQDIAQGVDILIATPGRLYDLALSHVLQLKSIQKLVIDEVDIMLDLGFRHQLINLFYLLPERRQNIMFSATMTTDVDDMITAYFKNPERISIAVSGTPLDNIVQERYNVPNYFTKLNLVSNLLKDRETFHKVILFVGYKRMADRLFENLEEQFPDDCCVIHSNKTQNYRLRSIEHFRSGEKRILIATDVMARGLDIDNVSQVINFDTPEYPENYMHRIGRTGRAEKEGHSILLSTEKELEHLAKIEDLMDMKINCKTMPSDVEISKELIDEERTQIKEHYNPHKRKKDDHVPGPAFTEKSEKNQKENLGGSYKFKIAKKYKKPKTRGDKNYNKKKRR